MSVTKRDRRLRKAAANATPATMLLSAIVCMAATGQDAVRHASLAQDSWNPFAENNGIKPPPRRDAKSSEKSPGELDRPPLAPMQAAPAWGSSPQPADMRRAPGPGTGPEAAAQTVPANIASQPVSPRDAVERTDLEPLTSAQAAPTGGAAGAGYDPRALGPLLIELTMPSRSPALTALLRRLLAGPDALLAGTGPEQIGLRAEALYRAGLISDALAVLPAPSPTQSQAGDDPLSAALTARIALATGDRERACQAGRSAAQATAALPVPLKGDVLAIQGYCGAAEGNPAAAGLAAALAREEHAGSADTLAALEAVGAGEPPRLASAKRIGVLDYRLAELVKADIGSLPLDRAEPALLAVLAAGTAADPRLRLDGAEAAARLNVIDPASLAAVYRRQPFTADQLALAHSSTSSTSLRRAALLQAAEAERTPARKTRLVRALLDDARRAGLYLPVAVALSRAVDEVQPAAEISWFAETAVETMLVAGRYDKARSWTRMGAQPGTLQDHSIGGLAHWLGLIDIADPAQSTPRGESLAVVEEQALRGRFPPDALHRLASILDALDYDVPHRLWEAASRVPQPNSGHLPPTGVLAELQDAARKKDQVRTILLVFRALGPAAAEGAHIIALGDAIRALKRSGLAHEARQLALEALFAAWPRSSQG